LTDLSVFELSANLTKLRRIGLVKVVNLTDEGVSALVERHASLERIHLSYCDNISVRAVMYLLNHLMNLSHLSLTGVKAFKNPELQRFRKEIPPVSALGAVAFQIDHTC
jgi:F-box and leucine-rich repeat protein GRR1